MKGKTRARKNRKTNEKKDAEIFMSENHRRNGIRATRAVAALAAKYTFERETHAHTDENSILKQI